MAFLLLIHRSMSSSLLRHRCSRTRRTASVICSTTVSRSRALRAERHQHHRAAGNLLSAGCRWKSHGSDRPACRSLDEDWMGGNGEHHLRFPSTSCAWTITRSWTSPAMRIREKRWNRCWSL